MEKHSLRIISIFFCLNNFAYASRTNFDVKLFELCNHTQGIAKFYGNITKEGNQHYLSYNITSPIPWGGNVGMICRIESKTFGNYVELFTIREKDICKSANIYLGEFWYDVQRAAQMPKGVCPMEAGRRHVNHMPLDFTKISLQTFPFGRLRFIINAVENAHKKSNVWCILLEVENLL